MNGVLTKVLVEGVNRAFISDMVMVLATHRVGRNECCSPKVFAGGGVAGAFMSDVVFFLFFGVHPLWMTTTSPSTLMTQHEEEKSMY